MTTTDRKSAVSQSEFEAITCNRWKARENARVQVAIGIGFNFHWLKKLVRVLVANHRAKQCKTAANSILRLMLN